jgi:hypothetical protein
MAADSAGAIHLLLVVWDPQFGAVLQELVLRDGVWQTTNLREGMADAPDQIWLTIDANDVSHFVGLAWAHYPILTSRLLYGNDLLGDWRLNIADRGELQASAPVVLADGSISEACGMIWDLWRLVIDPQWGQGRR